MFAKVCALHLVRGLELTHFELYAQELPILSAPFDLLHVWKATVYAKVHSWQVKAVHFY